MNEGLYGLMILLAF